MTVSPLLVLAQGRKVRLRKVPAVRPLEITLHLSCVKLLRDHCRPDWQWCHVPLGEIRDKRTAGKLRRMGTKAGWPDLILIPPTGQICCLELKRIGERLSDSQHDFRTTAFPMPSPSPSMTRSPRSTLGAASRSKFRPAPEPAVRHERATVPRRRH
jgi:hypothetical protein